MTTRMEAILFTAGDLAGGALVGVATAAAVRMVITAGFDMALAMVAGMAIGMVVHLPISLLLAPVLGMLHTMVPAGLTGMYGGMLFAMRDCMDAHRAPLRQALVVGAGFGVLVALGVHAYDAAVRRRRP